MSKEDLILNLGGSVKYALEGRDKDEPSIFLESLGLRDTVRLQRLHQDLHIQWIGGRFDKDLDVVLDKEAIVRAKGSGCLKIEDPIGCTTIFMDKGEIVKEYREVKGVDPRQSRMNI